MKPNKLILLLVPILLFGCNESEPQKQYNDEEISIKCKTNQKELSKKGLCLSFVLQGNVYSIPLENLFAIATGYEPKYGFISS